MNSDLHFAVKMMAARGVRYAAAMDEFEALYIIEILDRLKGNQHRAAEVMGMHRNTLSRKMAELGISNRWKKAIPPKPHTRDVRVRRDGEAPSYPEGFPSILAGE